MNEKIERRAFNRFPVEIEVSCEGLTGKKFKEKTALLELSGGGAKFKTSQAEEYFPGQLLYFTIHLPGTEQVKAHMRGVVKVIRIGFSVVPEKKDQDPEIEIAVIIDNPLHFERILTK